MTPDATVFADVTTADGYLLVLAVIVPVIGILLSIAFGGRYVERIALVLLVAGLGHCNRYLCGGGSGTISRWSTL